MCGINIAVIVLTVLMVTQGGMHGLLTCFCMLSYNHQNRHLIS